MQNQNSTRVFSNPYQAIAVLVGLAIWCWVDVWPRGRLDPDRPDTHRTDFTVYTAAGKAALAGENPYSVTNARGWSYLYLPSFALVVSPLAILPEGWQCIVWFWVSVACLYGAFREFALLDRWAFPRDGSINAGQIAGWGGIVCLFGFSLATLNCLQRGQVGILQLYMTLLGGRMILTKATRMSAMVGGAILAGAIILKISPALPTVILVGGLAFMAMRTHASQMPGGTRSWSRMRPLTVTIGLLTGLAVGIWIFPASIVGWERNQTYLETWRRDVLARTNELSNDPFAGDSHSTKNQSPMNGFWLLGNTLFFAREYSSCDQEINSDGLAIGKASSHNRTLCFDSIDRSCRGGNSLARRHQLAACCIRRRQCCYAFGCSNFTWALLYGYVASSGLGAALVEAIRGRASGAVRSQAEPGNEQIYWCRSAKSIQIPLEKFLVNANTTHPIDPTLHAGTVHWTVGGIGHRCLAMAISVDVCGGRS